MQNSGCWLKPAVCGCQPAGAPGAAGRDAVAAHVAELATSPALSHS
jgi:hypothetical protein